MNVAGQLHCTSLRRGNILHMQNTFAFRIIHEITFLVMFLMVYKVNLKAKARNHPGVIAV